jgi:CheY-like chemotaxis protein
MDDTPTTLLVAERDERTRAFLLDNLAADGYEPLGAQTEEETSVKLRHRGPALLVLGGLGDDRRAPGLVRAIRSGAAGGDPTLPVIVLGERAEELELLRAFEAGCDHFVPKPFSYLELRARVRACISARPGVAAAAPARGGHARGRPRRAQRAPSGPGPAAQPARVRPARPPCRRVHARVHEVRAPARGLGLQGDGHHPVAGRSDRISKRDHERGGRTAKLRFGGGAGAGARPAPLAPATANGSSLPSVLPYPLNPRSPKERWRGSRLRRERWVPGLYGNPRDPRDRATGTAGREAAAGGARSAGHVTGRTGRTGGAELSRSGGSRPLGRLSLFTGRTRRVVVPRVRSASVAPAAGPCRAASRFCWSVAASSDSAA